MLKRIGVFFLLCLLVVFSTAGSLNLRGQTASQRVETFFGSDPIDERDASLGRPAGFTQAYETPANFEPDHGGLCIILRGHHQSYVTAIAFLDSLFNGTIAESAWTAGTQLRATVCIDPEATKVARQGTELTIAEAVAIAARSGIYEVAATSSGNDLLGWHGLTAGVKPSYGGVTGMSRTYVDTLAAGFQNWATDTAFIPAFRTWCYAGERYLGDATGNVLYENGFFQAFGRARNIQALRTDHDSTETFPESGYNFWQYPSAAMSYGNVDRGVGFHGIGEQVSRWDYGGRLWNDGATGNDAGAVIDSVQFWTDIGIQTPSVGVLIFDGAINAASTSDDISYANFRNLCFFWVHRVQEGLLRTYTAEQTARYARGIRIGNIFNTKHFTVLQDSTTSAYRYGAVSSNLHRSANTGPPATTARANKAPINFSMADEHLASSTADTLTWVGIPLTGGSGAVASVCNLSRNGDSLAAAYSSPDSVSYGLSSSTSNVLMVRGHDRQRGRPIAFTIVTMGSPATEIRVSAQFMIHSNIVMSGDSAAADTLYMSGKFFQFSERWDDHMDEGPSSYQLMSVFASFAGSFALPDTTVLPDSVAATRGLLYKGRVAPQFLQALFMADTTATGQMLLMLDAPAGTNTFWYKRLLAMGTFELRPTLLTSARSQDYDYRYTIGNPRSLSVAAVVGHEMTKQDLTLVLTKGRIYTANFTVAINERTDYVKAMLCLENIAGTVSGNWVMSYLDISAWGMN